MSLAIAIVGGILCGISYLAGDHFAVCRCNKKITEISSELHLLREDRKKLKADYVALMKRSIELVKQRNDATKTLEKISDTLTDYFNAE